ncbi:MAG TPA: tetratricopeptide repeat protein [Pyrinomonadaceae bacterium]|nr:tetratricopeptide repeat protein [Pyrinomonadaceae bacterium]
MSAPNWLRLGLMVFYAPIRGLREVRDRAPLAPIGLMAFISQLAYNAITQLLVGNRNFFTGPGQLLRLVFQATLSLLLIGIILAPLVTFVANVFERRASFSLRLQQEYGSVASALLYAFVIANLISLPVSIFFHFSGVQAAYVAQSFQSAAQVENVFRLPADLRSQLELTLRDPQLVAAGLFRTVKLLFFFFASIFAVREVFRVSVLRAVAVAVIALVLALFISPLWTLLLSPVLASPFLVIILFLLIRGYIANVTRTQRARESFKQNLEAATLNPADASAHYNLGLIHQQRGELDAARERFERAVQIDEEEIDAHYQLGRIARSQKRFADAIRNFEQVVARDQGHAQHEIWREVGATYIAAGQFEDARNALETFLDRRPSDPEALYLMGRAHAGLGHQREAASSMQACIEAVKTAPAYKYRADKRWLNEAQQFIKTSQKAVVSRQ